MDNLEKLETSYKAAVEQWVDAIRNEEALANGDFSMVEWEKWDEAGLHVHDVELAAKKARDLFKNALRRKNYGF
jgi:hypothetical protein